MSTLANTTVTRISRIPLGRRISEIMQERGDAFSIRAFSARIDMNREVLRKIINGERTVLPSELEKIAGGLGMSLDRLKQVDTYKLENELEALLQAEKKTKAILSRSLKLATEWVSVAVGLTERGLSLLKLGNAQYSLQQYDEAHDTWLAVLEIADKLNQEYSDSSLLFDVSSLLLLSYTIRKEYTNIVQTLNLIEVTFPDEPLKMGYVHYTRMKWHEHRGNLEKAREHAYLALQFFEKTNDKDQIGKAYINIAHFEFQFENYLNSKEALAIAMENLKGFDYFYLLAVKEYVKTLLRLKDYVTARQLIVQNSVLAEEYPEYLGKLQIMYSITKNDPSYAEAVSQDLSMSEAVRSLACKYLMNYYNSRDDAESLMRYYRMGNSISTKNNVGYFDEGDL